MWQSWANYLLGAVTGRESQEPTVTEAQETLEQEHPRLTAIDDGDWVVVEQESGDNSDGASSEKSYDGDVHEDFRQRVLSTSSRLTRTSSSSSLPINLEESWFLTPPPCFTSSGPIHMETSPLENLLIEHPSMSVYHNYNNTYHYPRRYVSTMSSDSRDTDVDDIHDLQMEDYVVERTEGSAPIQMVPRNVSPTSSSDSEDTDIDDIHDFQMDDYVPKRILPIQGMSIDDILGEIKEGQRLTRNVSPTMSNYPRGNDPDRIVNIHLDDIVVERRERGLLIQRVPRRYRLQRLQQHERQYSKSKQAQKMQIQRSSQILKKAHLERNNKAREVNCRNRRQRRGERSQGLNRSRANNNRKC